MPRRLPRLLRLPLHTLLSHDGLIRHVDRLFHPRNSDLPRTVYPYAFKSDERAFAHALLVRRTQLWVFRAHQAAACGDFFVVDLSHPDPARRRAFAIELKQGRPLKEGSAGYQLRNAALAMAELAARGLVGRDTAPLALTGDRAAVLGYFAVGA